MQRLAKVELGEENRVLQVVPPGEQRRELAKRPDRLVAQLHTARLNEKFACFVVPLVAHAAHAELPGELLDDPLEVGELVHRLALCAFVKRREPPTRQRDGQAPAFRRLAVVVAEHAPNLEQRRVGGVVVGVVLKHVGQAGQQTRPQLVLLAAQRVFERHRRDTEQRRRLAGNQRLRLRLVQAKPGEDRANLRERIVRGVERIAANTPSRRRGRNLIDSVNANDLLNQIDFALQVHPRRRNPKCRRRVAVAGHRLEAKPGERGHLFVRRNRDAKQRVGPGKTQRNLPRLSGRRVGINAALGQAATGSLDDELRGSLADPVAAIRVATALETVRRIGADAQALGRCADVLRLKIGALDQHVLGAGGDLAVEPAHDSGEGDALGFVGDQQRAARQLVFLFIERREFFAGGGIAHDDHRLGRAVRLCEQMKIERVQRLAGLEHHVVCDIDDVVDAADADPLERVAQPTRTGADLHAANDARVVARAVLGVVKPHIDERRGVVVARRQVGDLRQSKRIAGERADLAGDADEAVPVRPVRRHLEVVNHIVAAAAQVLGERLANLRVLRQNHQPFGVVGEAKLLRRTHHALRLDAADFADLDFEWLLARLAGHHAARRRQRHLAADLEIRRAADDLPLARAVVYLAE